VRRRASGGTEAEILLPLRMIGEVHVSNPA
jgi:hypothetical protein